jgi:hypothetical protein
VLVMTPDSGASRLKDAVTRMNGGEWFCRAPVTIQGPAASFDLTPGATYRKARVFNGVDVVAVLDIWLQTGTLPPDFTVR